MNIEKLEWFKEFDKYFFAKFKKDADLLRALEIKEKYAPKNLFQYNRFNEFSLENIENENVYLSKPSSFNAPYDCINSFDDEKALNSNQDYFLNEFIDPEGIEKIKNKLQSNAEGKGVIDIVVDHLFQQMNRKDRRKSSTIKKHISSEIKSIYSKERDKLEIYLEEQKDAIGVSCFVVDNQSIPMWAHYADNHKGYCVEYDISENQSTIDDLFPVIYRDEIFDSTYLADRLEGLNAMYFMKMALVKSLDWSYEREWRLIVQKKAASPYKMQKLKSIYLGLNISKENKEKITKLCKKKSINVFQMHRHKTKFELLPMRIID